MPYIPDDRRSELKNGVPAETAGELTYLIYKACKDFIKSKPQRYVTYAMMLGAVECAKQELYRQILIPYEDEKKEEHGDV